VLVIAHRGNSSEAPENTLPSFASAVALGVDLVELDTHASADEIPVVVHDETIDRTTSACTLWSGRDIPLASKSLADLRQLDAGAWFAPRFATTAIATLDEALAVIQPSSMTLIERKQGRVEPILEVLRRHGAMDRVVVQAFDWDFLAQCRRQAPALLIGALGEQEITDEHLDRAVKLGAAVIGWKAGRFTSERISAIHQRGMRAWAWTVNDEPLARRLIAAGIDGLISNFPARMQAIVRSASAS
jgi:glycerophosphoryl diester phosphodiesterase